MALPSLTSFSFDHHIREVVARNIHAVRQERGLTLAGLAEMSGLGKDILSGIENRVGDPTMEILWQLAKALNVPFGQLLESDHCERSVVSAGVTSTLIDNQDVPQTIETYLMEIVPFTTYRAQAHMVDVKEHIVLLQGDLVVGADVAPMYLQPGQTHSFLADRPHVYRSLDQAVLAIVTVVYPLLRQTRSGIFDHNRAWPRTDDEWMGLSLQVARLRLEVSQGVAAARLSFTSCDLSNADMLARLSSPVFADTEFQSHVQTWALLDVYLVLLILPRPHAPVFLQAAPAASPGLRAAIALSNRANALSLPLTAAEITKLQQDLHDPDVVIAILAADVLSRHGSPAVPARLHLGAAGINAAEGDAEDINAAEGINAAEDGAAARQTGADYAVLHPAYARQSVAIANQIAARCLPGQNHLLDVGAGSGLIRQMLPGFVSSVSVVDASEAGFRHLSGNTAAQAQPCFDMAVSVGVSWHMSASHFLQAMHRQLKPGAFFLVTDEMLTPFANAPERSANLIAHHLQYVLDTMVALPLANLAESELLLVESVRQEVPMAVFEARTGEGATAVNRCRLMLKNLSDLVLPASVSHELLGFYRFHLAKLEVLVAGLDYETEQKTHARQFADLAQHAGFDICEHRRLYPTHGTSEWDGGTHLFVLKALA